MKTRPIQEPVPIPLADRLTPVAVRRDRMRPPAGVAATAPQSTVANVML
jgi:hypothetical protein